VGWGHLTEERLPGGGEESEERKKESMVVSSWSLLKCALK